MRESPRVGCGRRFPTCPDYDERAGAESTGRIGPVDSRITSSRPASGQRSPSSGCISSTRARVSRSCGYSLGGRMLGAVDELEVWFLTGSQTLYGDAILQQVAEDSSQLVAALKGSGSIPVRIVYQPVLTEPEGIRRQILAANSSDRCVGVIAWMHTFSPARMWIAGLSALHKPLLHLHTQ